MAHQALLRLEAEHQRLGTGADDDHVAPCRSSSRIQTRNGRCGEVDRGDLLGDDLGAEPAACGPHVGHQVGAHDAVREAGEVLDLGRQHELTARLVARTRRLAFDDQRRQVGSGGVDRCGQTGWTRPDDDDVTDVGHGDSLEALGMFATDGRLRPRQLAAVLRFLNSTTPAMLNTAPTMK